MVSSRVVVDSGILKGGRLFQEEHVCYGRLLNLNKYMNPDTWGKFYGQFVPDRFNRCGGSRWQVWELPAHGDGYLAQREGNETEKDIIEHKWRVKETMCWVSGFSDSFRSSSRSRCHVVPNYYAGYVRAFTSSCWRQGGTPPAYYIRFQCYRRIY